MGLGLVSGIRRGMDKAGRAMFEALLSKYTKPTYNLAGLITDKNSDFVGDPAFVKAFEAARKQAPANHPEWGEVIKWQVHVVLWAAAHSARLPGDFVECGVNTGIYSMAVMTHLDFASMGDRRFFLLDTFKGFAEETLRDDEKKLMRVSERKYPDCYEFVKDTLGRIPNAVIIRGAVPATLPQAATDRVAYLSIDMNCVEPEVAALEHFWPKLASGGIVVLDDYGWPGHQAQKEAHDQFARSVGTSVLCLPTGQGIILKA
ncbi:MAG: class I SAM-dependent methyltransferase [Nitrospinae bacterium]|nr:class I SAM-dependent methyltransferase [Nitrospinota bacterium]